MANHARGHYRPGEGLPGLRDGEKEPAAEQQKFFLHHDPTLFLLRGEDMTLQQNYELHQKLTDEKHGRSAGTSRTSATSRSGPAPSARSTGRHAGGAGPKPS